LAEQRVVWIALAHPRHESAWDEQRKARAAARSERRERQLE